jgi:predicted phosphodiesterase
VELDVNKNWIRQNNILPVFGKGTNDWTQRTVEFQTGADTRYLYVYANIWNGYGDFWMDDVELSLKNAQTPTPTVTTTPKPTVTATPPTPSGSCYVISGGIPSSMTKYVGKTVCASCGHHSPISSTWKPCGTTPTVTPTAKPTVTVTPNPTLGSTIAYLGDARPSKFGTAGITELTKDLNQVVPQSPTGKVDAIFMIGDMDRIAQTQKAYAASNVKNIPVFYVMGNHEIDQGDAAAVRAMYSSLKITPTSGPTGTDKTTYSLNVGGIHIVNMNEYWDGKTNDAYWKYGGIEGGYIPTALSNWLDKDLSNTTNWKIVVGHEPLYPKSRHVGDSLDKDVTNRNNLQNLFVSKKVSVFIGAHTHYATVNAVGGVYHVDAGISGQKTVDGEDPYASIFYTYTTANNLVLTWKHENPTWSTPRIATYTISK